MLILRGEIAKQRNRKKLLQLEKDLNSILTKWKFGDEPIRTSKEFLNKFTPWVNEKLKLGKEVEEFLKEKKVSSLSELL